jgi:hypothetical protein
MARAEMSQEKRTSPFDTAFEEIYFESVLGKAAEDREAEQFRRNNSIAEWQMQPEEKEEQKTGQPTALQALLNSFGAFFWGASEEQIAVPVASPVVDLQFIECRYCHQMIKMVNDSALDEHEDECEKKLSFQTITEIGGKPKKLQGSVNPQKQRRQIKSISPPGSDDGERTKVEEAFLLLASEKHRKMAPLESQNEVHHARTKHQASEFLSPVKTSLKLVNAAPIKDPTGRSKE